MARARIAVRVQPLAARDELGGEHGGALLVRVTAPPVGGRANDAVCRIVAKAVGVPPSGVSIIRGARGREKLVEVDGVDDEELRVRLRRRPRSGRRRA
jgi:uncharacterized protein (TIGR00251 family)